METKDFIREFDSVPTKKEKKKKLSVQDNSGKKHADDAVKAVRELQNEPSVSYSNEPRSSENPSRLTNDQFHIHVEHGDFNETLPDLHLIDTTNGEATFFLDRCNTSEEQAKEAALQVMHDFQEECPNVLFFKDSSIVNANADNKFFHGKKDIYFFAGNSDLKSNGIQLHSTKNIIPDDMPFILSPDKRFLYFGPYKQSEAFNIADFKNFLSNGYNAYQKLDVPKLKRPLLTRPLNMDKVGHLEPLDSGETKENDLSQFSKSQITRTQTTEPSKFIIPKNEEIKPTISDLPKRSKPYMRYK